VKHWLALAFALLVLIATGVLADYVELMPPGQVVAVTASMTVATVGLWSFFKNSSSKQENKTKVKLRSKT
jgi:hypothetical protein